MAARADAIVLLDRPRPARTGAQGAQDAQAGRRPVAWGQLRLRTRLGVLFVLAFVLLAAGFGAVMLQVTHAADARLAAVTLDAQAQILRKILERQGAVLAASIRRIAEAPGLSAAMQRRDAAAVAAAVGGPAGEAAIPDLLRLEVVDAQDRVLHAYGPGAATAPPGEGRGADRGPDAPGPSREADGSFALRGTVPVPMPVPVPPAGGRPATAAGTVSAAVRLTAALRETAASTGTAVLLLDLRGTLVEATDPAVWARLAGTASPRTGIRIVRAGGRALSVSVVPLLDSAGGRLGSEMQVRDVTDAEDERRFTTVLSFTGVVLVLLLVPLVLYWIIDRAFRPLESVVAALNALSAGNTEVEVAGESRPDEIGAIARAVRVFRERNRELTRQRLRQERGRRRQERFIRQQMVQMGETLDVDGRLDMLADTESIEGALLQMERMEDAFPDGEDGHPAARTPGDDLGVLALGFRVMSLRVITQHRRMNQLVLELRDALKARTELIGLQQQFEIATKMQAEMLPQALPPRPDVQARGGLLPAREFGGDFYDFFPLGPTEIAVGAGNVAGGSLQSAFLALTARTLLKAVLVCGVSPAAAITKVNGLLAAENQKGLGVAAMVMLLDTHSSRLICCSSGIPAPLMLRRLGDAAAMRLPENPLLGRQHGLTFAEASFDLPLRTTLVVHTPGLAEGDEAGLLAALQSCNDPGADAVLNAVMSMASHDRGGTSRDASCVVFRYVTAV